jgi:chromate transporter
LIIFGAFVGYLAGGLLGALLMTVGIFLPAFSFSLIGHEMVEQLIDTPWLHTILDGITAGVVGIIAATALLLLPIAVTDVPTALIFLLVLALVIKWKSKVSTPVSVLLGAVVGWVVQWIYGL